MDNGKCPKVLILMATFNGSSHIRTQMISIQKQTHTNWELWIRDDKSIDDTVEIIREFAQSDNRIKLIEDELPSGSACKNFSILMEYARNNSMAPYVAFSDQDDIWMENKLRLLLKSIQDCEEILGPEFPCLTFSDLKVVGTNGSIIKESFWAMEQIDPDIDTSLLSLMNRNVVPGCSMLVNHTLLKFSVPVPNTIIMHDWWAVLIARIYGNIAFIDTTCMDYVQHGKNQIGARQRTLIKSILTFSAKPLYQYKKIKKLHKMVVEQLGSLLEMELPEAPRHDIRNFILLRQSNFFRRLLNAKYFSSTSLIVRLSNIIIS